MRLGVTLVFLCAPLVALAKPKCKGDGMTLIPFKGKDHKPKAPCKYHAVRQVCGPYRVIVTPGNLYVHPNYHVDSLWLSFSLLEGEGNWKGRTDNSYAAKYLNGWNDYLFVKNEGSLETEKVLKLGRDKKTAWVETVGKEFRVTFRPWEPDNPKFPTSSWEFECFEKDFVPAEYPQQVCGDRGTKENKERRNELGFTEPYELFYYDVFTNTKISQTNPKCVNVTHAMTEVCDDTLRSLAIITCTDIIYSYPHRDCVTKFSCDPMDVYQACIEWVCSNYKNRAACETVARGIDMCRTFTKGNLTELVRAANCYNEFHPIEGTYEKSNEEEEEGP